MSPSLRRASESTSANPLNSSRSSSEREEHAAGADDRVEHRVRPGAGVAERRAGAVVAVGRLGQVQDHAAAGRQHPPHLVPVFAGARPDGRRACRRRCPAARRSSRPRPAGRRSGRGRGTRRRRRARGPARSPPESGRTRSSAGPATRRRACCAPSRTPHRGRAPRRGRARTPRRPRPTARRDSSTGRRRPSRTRCPSPSRDDDPAGHGDEVCHSGQDHEHVEDLVEAERPRPRVRAAEREDHRAGGVEQAAGGDQDQRRRPAAPRTAAGRQSTATQPERDVTTPRTAPAAR